MFFTKGKFSRNSFIGKIVCLVSFVLFFCFFLRFLPAGDVANFVNLGFSKDGSFFTFSQYGYVVALEKAYGSIVTVNIAKNEFVEGSAIDESQFYLPVVGIGGFPDGILYLLIERYAKIRLQYGIDYTHHGRLLYMGSSAEDTVNHNDRPISGDAEKVCVGSQYEIDCSIRFEDSRTGTNYKVILNQEVEGIESEVPQSRLVLNLSVKSLSGVVKNYSVGHPNFVRKGVVGYQMESVILTPDEKGLVFVIAKNFYSDSEFYVRYMVETVLL